MAATTTDATLQFICKLRARGGDGLLGDGLLLERFVHGDDALAFETLVHRHGGMVLGLSVDLYVKVRVLRHQDNDAVEFEWAKLPAPKRLRSP